MPLNDHAPYEEAVKSTQDPKSDSPSRLLILGATWGGVNVTAELQGAPFRPFESITLNMHTIHTNLLPDPSIGTIKTLTTPSVLGELAQFFRRERGQIRTTSEFFKTDPWVGHKKSWTVYFRLGGLGEAVDEERVRCVTGMEAGALEVPWMF
ncbi:hypothetical protein N0V88_007152 [Collariella sp. IMI 366227]|nr:hypothetical protein N0V88_007152 [Collariella sp. IMI 366227]